MWVLISSLEALCQGASNEYPKHMILWRKKEKYEGRILDDFWGAGEWGGGGGGGGGVDLIKLPYYTLTGSKMDLLKRYKVKSKGVNI